MNRQVNILPELREDEIVRFIAERYHISPRDVIKRFLEQEGTIPGKGDKTTTTRLKDNEMEILRDLTKIFQASNHQNHG